MKEHPILFTGEMVKAMIEGRKTQTRRLVTRANAIVDIANGQAVKRLWDQLDFNRVDRIESLPLLRVNRPSIPAWHSVTCRYAVGDRLWVRETWADAPDDVGVKLLWYRADGPRECIQWKSPIHLRRSHCRLVLEITDIRVQRLQDISDDDAIAEGVTAKIAAQHCLTAPCGTGNCERVAFSGLWESINGARGFGWDSNPLVWAITFKRVAQ